MDKEKLKQIITDLKQVSLESQLKIKDSELMDFAIRIYNSENIKEVNLNDKPTEKQIAILKKNNIKITNDMTRNEVSQIIKELFDNNKKEVNDGIL